MSLFKALYNSYEYAQKNNMVDKIDAGEVILPMYHNKMKSNGKDIVRIKIDKDSNLLDANFIEENEIIIFPVTEDSVSRTSGIAPHPLADKGAYLFDLESKKNIAYMEKLKEWLDYSDNDFVKIIYKFLTKTDSFEKIIEKLYTKFEIKDNLKVEHEGVNVTKTKREDFSKIFFTFVIEDFDGLKDISISENKSLHKLYIDYTNYLNKNDKEKNEIICNISGLNDYSCTKHRPLMGSAKLISQREAKKENYFGRFNKAEETIEIGTDSSQKIHLMAAYLLSSKKTSVWLGSKSYLVNWFSDDIRNDSGLNLNTRLERRRKKLATPIGNNVSEEIGKSFLKGEIKFSDSSKYYIAVFDKVNDGRIAAKYFRELDISILKENLRKWQSKYFWFENNKEGEEIIFTPSPYNIVVAAYGKEVDGNLKLNDDKFLKNQLQNLISFIIEGKDISENITRALGENIRKRRNYDKSWQKLKKCALAILRYKEGIDNNMLDRKNLDRSYLYGRLLAIYERIEKTTFDGDENVRVTNAEKLWTSYVNNPVSMNLRLRNTIKPYQNKLLVNENKRGIYYKLIKEMSEITNLIGEHYDYREEKNKKALGAGFIFGYEGEMKEIFTKKTNEEEKND